ncbi:hypothetical protein B0H17DRAFT_1072052 [Mycena rosella]|uniref:Uncharacterized protein n=1 Tax=Mycena rosella TaxID=1033263 RepID=A0AAD7DB30_MYCRO|nr:hypothetical protein B0H17DRAFT_1072052 [Mycena rosella]
MSASLAPTSFNMALPSDSTAHARPPKAPPLNSTASTPGLEVPGGYPRDSVVFAGNKWDHGNAPPGLLSTAKAYLPAPITNAKAYLPPAVASYFPSTETASKSEISPRIVKANADPTVHTPYPAVLNTDGSVSAASDFSTRAYAGSSSGLPTPTPGDFPGVPSSEGYFPQVSPPSTPDSHPPSRPSVSRRPHTPPPLPPTSSSTSGSAGSTPTSASTAPSSPASASLKKSPSGFARWASRSLSKRSSAPPAAHASSPPSAFASPPPSAFAKPRASLDTSPPPSAPATSPTATKSAPAEQAPPPKRRASLLRTLRGEAKVLSGRVRRDPGRVEAGRRMLSEA